jgi:hypothetical protein
MLASMRSTATITAVFLASLTFVLGLVTLLNYFKFQSSFSDLAERRVGTITERIHGSLETAIDLGLNLRDIEVTRSILANTQAQDTRIENIFVFSTDNARIVFASDPAAIGGAADPGWLSAQASAKDGAWRIQAGNRVLIGRQLDSELAKNIGGVVLVYSLADVVARVDAMRDHLISNALATLAIFSVVAVLSAVLVTRDFRKTVSGLSDAIGSTEPEEGAAAVPESLLSSINRFRRVASEAQTQLDGFEEALADETPGERTGASRQAGVTG